MSSVKKIIEEARKKGKKAVTKKQDYVRAFPESENLVGSTGTDGQIQAPKRRLRYSTIVFFIFAIICARGLIVNQSKKNPVGDVDDDSFASKVYNTMEDYVPSLNIDISDVTKKYRYFGLVELNIWRRFFYYGCTSTQTR